MLANGIEKARMLLTSAHELAHDLADKQTIISTSLHLGCLSIKMNKLDLAQRYFETAERLMLPSFYAQFPVFHKFPIFHKYMALFHLSTNDEDLAIKNLDIARRSAAELLMQDQIRHIDSITKNFYNKSFRKNPLFLGYL